MQRSILPEPPEELKSISHALVSKLHDELRADGFMPFSRYMERSLYEPGLGYYSAGLHKLGREGDFVTAPELGCLFARCLAAQVQEIGTRLDHYDILELGAGTGRMAADLLTALTPENGPRRYRILDRSADLRAVQQQLIADRVPLWIDRVEWLDAPPAEPWQGVVLANEVIDALAVERFRVGPDGIEQAGISRAANADGFTWGYRPAPAALAQAVHHLGLALPPGYTSEINLNLPDWLASVTSSLTEGSVLLVDYGYPRSEYYLPQRSDGTLVCHYRHHGHDDVFFWPGLQDITAFVDFTAVAEAGAACGLELAGYCSQAMFLLGCGLDQLLQPSARNADVDFARTTEARHLTLPGMMGERFQVMALARGDLRELRGFALQDLTYRL